jgi:hypothetical protein
MLIRDEPPLTPPSDPCIQDEWDRPGVFNFGGTPPYPYLPAQEFPPLLGWLLICRRKSSHPLQ